MPKQFGADYFQKIRTLSLPKILLVFIKKECMTFSKANFNTTPFPYDREMSDALLIWRIKSNYLSVYGTRVWWRMKNCFKLFPNAKLAWRQCSISIPSQTTETCCFYWCFQWVQTGNTGVNWGDMKNQKQLFKCLWHRSLMKNEKLF